MSSVQAWFEVRDAAGPALPRRFPYGAIDFGDDGAPTYAEAWADATAYARTLREPRLFQVRETDVTPWVKR
jgi:hypothetical protein